MMTSTGSDTAASIQHKADIAKWLLALVRKRTLETGPLSGIEVGVKQGNLAAAMLRLDDALSLVLVDRWRPAPADSAYARFGDPAAIAPAEVHERWRREAAAAVAFAAGRATIIQGESTAVAATLGPQQAHFVFLDADHSYDARLADLEAWCPHVVAGGIIAGGLWRSGFGGDCCKRAVNIFCWRQRIECGPWFGPGQTWALQKPEA